jgi:hypothetical protein
MFFLCSGVLLMNRTALCLTVLIASAVACSARADTVEFADGKTLTGAYVQDEGVRYLLWDDMEAVGKPPRIVPRSAIKSVKIERGEAWDRHPALPDLSVTFIEMNPKLAGLHGKVDYDTLGRPLLNLSSTQGWSEGERARDPEKAAAGLKLKYAPGETITLTAHVRNVGFAAAKPFRYAWRIDGKETGRGRFTKSLAEMGETTFSTRWNWREGRHTVTFEMETDGPEIAVINNAATDPLWGWGLEYIVNPGRVAAWHQNRTAYGTFSFEDFYRWHIDLMNALFAASAYPSAPEGIRARVRIDRITYAEDVEKASEGRVRPDGLRYDQGAWIWIDDQDKNKKWEPPTKEWRNATEWSLPHELGHQLGLTDLYGLDYEGNADHVWPDTGEPIQHFMSHPITMMHWHGPNLYSEVDAGYLNQSWDKPRGYFGDFYFALPRENALRIVDVNGRGVPGARVAIYQRGAAHDPNGKATEMGTAKVFPVLEDGNFDRPVPKEPVITGATDPDGLFRLPNRPAAEARTLNGFRREPNPFGNLNVVGNRGLMLVAVIPPAHGPEQSVPLRPEYFWLEVTDFNTAWFRGHKDTFTMTLATPFGSEGSPPPPGGVTVTRLDENRVRLSWDAPQTREQHYLDRPVGFRAYRRISNEGLNDRPWFVAATLGPDAREAVLDLRQTPQDLYFYSKRERFGVTAVGERGLESERVEVALK